MNFDPHDDIRRELEAALAVEPAPGFAARVRSRIARDERRQPMAWKWRVALLCAAVPALVLMVLYVGRIGSRSASQTTIEQTRTVDETRTTNRSALRTDSATQTADRSAAVDVGRTKLRSADPRPTTGRAARRSESANTSARRLDSPDRPLVPDDQRVALVRLLKALRAGRANVPSTVGATFGADGALVEPAPVVVPLLKIDPLPIPDPEGDPERDQR